MNKYELVSKIEHIAPLDSQEPWDSSGWVVETGNKDINKIMLALTVTEDVVQRAKEKHCDMIIAHHPLFFVPFEYKDIDIYASHTPMDKAVGGTTETLIKSLGFEKFTVYNDFVRIVECNIGVNDFRNKLQNVSKNVRVVNNKKVDKIHSIGFCAGSGSEFINDGVYDAFVTGDVKYHTAVETDKVVFDIGHFESEILILNRFKEILGVEVEMSNEETPFS